MSILNKYLSIICFIGLLAGCASKKSAHLADFSKINDTLLINTSILNQYDLSATKALKQYLIGNPAWDFVDHRGKTYAIRNVFNDSSVNNNIYIQNSNGEKFTSRIIISFNCIAGINNQFQPSTLVPIKDSINLQLLKSTKINSSHNSYLIVENSNFNIEIFESSKSTNRIFTKDALQQLLIELKLVIEKIEIIKTKGKIPIPQLYPFILDSSFFSVVQNKELGNYKATASIQNNIPGYLFLKVFEAKYNSPISEKYIQQQTKKRIGWSMDKSEYFYYQTDFKILEGAVSDALNARIELWFIDFSGNQKKLMDINKDLYSWKRH